jgi:hypothetical protein
VLLIKWQNDGDYLGTMLDIISGGWHSKFIFRPTVAVNPGENLFKLISERVTERKTSPY